MKQWHIRTALVLLLFLALSPMGALAEVTWDSEDLAWRKDTSAANFSLFFNMHWAPFDVWGTDHVSQQVTEDTGISFEATKSQNDNHIATIIATGEWPDAFFIQGQNNIDLLENNEICYPWDELIDEYAPEFWDLIDPSEIDLAMKDDGHFYTLYTHVRNQEYWDDMTRGVSYGQGVISFRDDIMEALGNPEIDDVNDLYSVLKQVKELYPDMIPYVHQKINLEYMPYLFGIGYDRTKGAAKVVDGEAVYAYSERQPVTDYVTFMNKLVRENLMSQESLTYNYEQTKAAVLGGDVFCFTSQAFDVDQINSALASLDGDTRYYTAIRKPLTVDGDLRYDLTYAQGGYAGFYITRACKDPGRLIALMEYMKSPYGDRLTQWGVEGLDYDLVDGYPIQNDTYSWKERGDNVWYFQASFDVENQKAIAKAATDPRYGQVAHLVTDFKPFWHYDPALALVNNPEANTKMGDIRATIDQLKENSLSTMIVSRTDEDLKVGLDNYFSALDNAGLAEYNQFLNDQYQEMLAKLAE